MKSKWTEDKIKYLAKKYKLRETTIRMIVMSQFETVRDVMSSTKRGSEYFPSIRLPLLGVFKPSKRKLKYLRKKKRDEHYEKVKRKKSLNL